VSQFEKKGCTGPVRAGAGFKLTHTLLTPPGVGVRRSRLAALVLLLAGWAADLAAAPRPLQFWNLTAATITELYLAPAGRTGWSGNLCLSDPDHTVEADERLAMPGIKPGIYDVRVVDVDKRACVFRRLRVDAGGPYALSIAEAAMQRCSGD
jgi:hypothetical protein